MSLRVLSAALAPFRGTAAFAADLEVRTVPLKRKGTDLHLQCIQLTGSIGERNLLMVHGLTYSSHEFDVNYGDYSLARYFASKGYSVWLLDIAGYGSSQQVDDGFMPDSNYAAEDIAAASRLILEQSGQKALDVLGWSWGTVTSGRFAAKYPERVRKLVLYAPIVAGLGTAKVEVPYNHNTWLDAAGDFQTREDKTIDNEITEQPVLDTFLSNCWRYDGENSPNGGRRDLLVDPKVRLIPTASIKAPTLIIVGDRDPYVTVALCEEATRTLTGEGSRLEVIPGAGHAMMMEKPYYRTFREAVLEFLQ